MAPNRTTTKVNSNSRPTYPRIHLSLARSSQPITIVRAFFHFSNFTFKVSLTFFRSFFFCFGHLAPILVSKLPNFKLFNSKFIFCQQKTAVSRILKCNDRAAHSRNITRAKKIISNSRPTYLSTHLCLAAHSRNITRAKKIISNSRPTYLSTHLCLAAHSKNITRTKNINSNSRLNYCSTHLCLAAHSRNITRPARRKRSKRVTIK